MAPCAQAFYSKAVGRQQSRRAWLKLLSKASGQAWTDSMGACKVILWQPLPCLSLMGDDLHLMPVVTQTRMRRLEGVRLEVDSRRRTVVDLRHSIEAKKAKPQTPKLEFQTEQLIKKMQHKENKLASRSAVSCAALTLEVPCPAMLKLLLHSGTGDVESLSEDQFAGWLPGCF